MRYTGESGDLFRAMVTIHYNDTGEEYSYFYGPYSTKGAATSAVRRELNSRRESRFSKVVAAEVHRCEPSWKAETIWALGADR